MSLDGTLQERIEHWFAQGTAAVGDKEAEAAFLELRTGLEAGELRSAEPDDSALGWRVNAWIKRGILLGFRLGSLVEMGSKEGLSFVDKATYPARQFAAADGVRAGQIQILHHDVGEQSSADAFDRQCAAPENVSWQ